MKKAVKELTSIIKNLPEETVHKLIQEYKPISQEFIINNDLFLVNYRILGFGADKKIFILEYVNGEYVKVVKQKVRTLDRITPVRIIDGNMQFISYEDDSNKGNIYRWTYDGSEFKSVDTKIKQSDVNFLDKSGNIFTLNINSIKKYSKTNELVGKGEWRGQARREKHPEHVYQLSNDKILITSYNISPARIYNANTLERIATLEISGEHLFQLSLNTFLAISSLSFVFTIDSNGNIDRLFDFPPDVRIEMAMGNYAMDTNGQIYELDLINKKYREIQKINVGEAESCGPYVFSAHMKLYRLNLKAFQKVYKSGSRHLLSEARTEPSRPKGLGVGLNSQFIPIPITRYDKLKAAKHLEILNVSTDLSLIVVDYMNPEIP